jgi:hypothetical protein
MNQPTPDQGWQELKDHIENFLEHVNRVEKEKAILSLNESKPRNPRRAIELGPIIYRPVAPQGGSADREAERPVGAGWKSDDGIAYAAARPGTSDSPDRAVDAKR